MLGAHGFVFAGDFGLITPSLEEMAHVASEMKRQGMKQPLLIGGATTSRAHTAIKIAPHYEGTVVYVPDASRAVGVVTKLLSIDNAAGYKEEVAADYERVRELASGDQPFLVHNDTFGTDPDQGRVKTLRIDARDARGKTRTFNYREDAVVDGRQFAHRQFGNATAGVKQDVVVDEEGSGAQMAPTDAAAAAEYAQLHARAPALPVSMLTDVLPAIFRLVDPARCSPRHSRGNSSLPLPAGPARGVK
jgi:hypothetical protein